MNYLIGLLLLSSCFQQDGKVDDFKLNGYDFRIFQNTPAWNLAKAVSSQDRIAIKKLVSSDKSLLEVTDPKFGQTLLKMAVQTKKYDSMVALVELGANPNSHDSETGSSPMLSASDMGYGKNILAMDSRFLKFLLKNGGNPNDEEIGARKPGNNTRYTPLFLACTNGNLEYVKLLLSAGAKINHTNDTGINCLFAASVAENPELVIYLLEKGADFKKPIYRNSLNKDIYLEAMVKNWNFEKGSEDYTLKMKIIAFLRKNGSK